MHEEPVAVAERVAVRLLDGVPIAARMCAKNERRLDVAASSRRLASFQAGSMLRNTPGSRRRRTSRRRSRRRSSVSAPSRECRLWSISEWSRRVEQLVEQDRRSRVCEPAAHRRLLSAGRPRGSAGGSSTAIQALRPRAASLRCGTMPRAAAVTEFYRRARHVRRRSARPSGTARPGRRRSRGFRPHPLRSSPWSYGRGVGRDRGRCSCRASTVRLLRGALLARRGRSPS